MARPTTAIITVLILAVLFLVFDLHQKTKQNLNYQVKFFKYPNKGSRDGKSLSGFRTDLYIYEHVHVNGHL